MKTKLIKFTLMAFIGVGTVYGVYNLQKKDQSYNLMLSNIDALASNESGGDIYCCGNYGECMKVTDLSTGLTYTVKGIKLSSPCP